MNNRIALFFLFTTIVILSACDAEQLADLVREPAPTQETAVYPVDTVTPETVSTETAGPTSTFTPTPQPSSTATPLPTVTPTVTPTPTPSPTPTPTPPSPEAILGLANMLHNAAESYHFDLTSETTMVDDETLSLSFAGDFLSPDVVSGQAIIDLGEESIESLIISYGRQYYESDSNGKTWRYYAVEPGAMGRSDIGFLWQDASPPQDFNSLEYKGIREIDGRAVYQISAVLSESLADPNVVGDIQAEFQIGVEDGFIHQFSVAYETFSPATDERQLTEDIYSFSNFNQPVEIDIPEVNIQAQEQDAPTLGIRYELPADWSIESSGDESCEEGLCPELRLFRDRPGGPRSEIKISAVAPASLPFLMEVMSGHEYEDAQVGALLARLREGEENFDGLLFSQPNKALQLSAQWAGQPEQEAIVREIAGSLSSAAPSAPEGFRTHKLPGWAYLDIPEKWTFLVASMPGVLEISSDDVDNLEDLGGDEALIQIFDIYDNDLSPVDLVREQVLDSEEYDQELLTGPEALTINGQDAATATFIGDTTLVEQVTIIQSIDGSHTIQLVSVAFEDMWPRYDAIFDTIRESARLYPMAGPPDIWPGKFMAEEQKLYVDDEEGFQAAYPTDWQFEATDNAVLFSPSDSDQPSDSDIMLDTVTIYPPSSNLGSDESAAEGYTLQGQMDALWDWSSTPATRDLILSSEGISNRRLGKDHAAGYFVATDEGREGQPIYGFMGVVTDGDSAVKMLSWSDDPIAFRKYWLDIFDSIRITTIPDLDWDNATPLTPGELLNGTTSSAGPQLYSFTAEVGETFALVSHIDPPEDSATPESSGFMELIFYDAQTYEPDYSNTVSPDFAQPMLLIVEQPGEQFISVESLNYEAPSVFDLSLLPVAEGEADVVDIAIGYLDDDCTEFGYAGVEGNRIAVFAEPITYYWDEVGLSLEVLDNGRELLYEDTAFYEEDLPENYEVELIGDNQIYSFTGLPIVHEMQVPEDGFIIRVCEPGLQSVEYELIVLALPEES